MKYELTTNTKIMRGRTLYQIKALKDFGCIKKGDLGGFVEKEANLSQTGDCWIYDNVIVSGNARIYDNVIVSENARIYGNATVSGNARIYGNATVSDNAILSDNARVSGNAIVSDGARVSGGAIVCENAILSDGARVSGKAWVYDNARVSGNAIVHDNTIVCDNARVYGNARIYDNARIQGDAVIRDVQEINYTPLTIKLHFDVTVGKDFTNIGCETRTNKQWMRILPMLISNSKNYEDNCGSRYEQDDIRPDLPIILEMIKRMTGGL